jgi:methylthioribose-1-phosphate isomerase
MSEPPPARRFAGVPCGAEANAPPVKTTSPIMQKVETLRWVGGIDGTLHLIDQTLLPGKLEEIACRDVATVWEAIKMLRVRGAPAIGIAAAYGVVLGVREATSEEAFQAALNNSLTYLAGSRPTAVNLFWALDRMRARAEAIAGQAPTVVTEQLLREARAIHEEDRALCRAIGRYGAELLPDGAGVLTHCNAGGLATAEYGTALSVFFTAQDQGKQLHVYVDETRPLLQGSRLTAWELVQRGIPATLICDSMAAQVMRERKVQAVVVGADRIAANGDTANKIGTYSVAVLAHAHGIPFYVAAPSTTFDLTIDSGDQIPIEQRSPAEITEGFGRPTAPAGVGVYNPAFDVTPAALIKGIITERGVIEPVTREGIEAKLRAAR